MVHVFRHVVKECIVVTKLVISLSYTQKSAIEPYTKPVQYNTSERPILVLKCRDSSVGIATGYGLDDRMIGVQFPVGTGNFSLRHRVQTGSGAHPKGTGGFFPGGKAARS
jgi:hypothetical protein